jgi:malonyl-ACP decarboxylase
VSQATGHVPLAITGMGVRTAVAGNVPDFLAALREGRSGIGRYTDPHSGMIWLAAMLPEAAADISAEGPHAARLRSILRRAPRSTAVACAVALEAFGQAQGAAALDGAATALVVAGSNLHQRYIAEHHERYAERRAYLPPRYAVHFADTDAVGAVSELLGLHGPGFTTGAAAASGNVALYQACQLLRCGEATACVCVAPVADFSDLDLQAFANLGAMHSGRCEGPPERECRPFDRGRRGFVYGQAGACLILETLEQARRRGATILAEVAGASLTLDGNHAADPSVAGEARAMRLALDKAGLRPEEVDYLNAHGTASAAGDEAECQAIRQVFGEQGRPAVNATKALVGHAYSAAGMVEAIATVLQMRHGFLHPNPNLDEPIDGRLRFVGKRAEPADIRCALSNSFGFGGINSCVVLRKPGGGAS